MNTVYRYFIDYYHSIMTNTSDPTPVEDGIASYLESIGIDINEESPNAETIANRELLRFKLMPECTFAAFFNNYGVREQITQIIRETELMAVNRAISTKTISQNAYTEKINQYYSISSDLMKDSRYTVWLENSLSEITGNLKYAAGLTDVVPAKVQERMLFASQYDSQENG